MSELSGFTAGFTARHNAAAEALHHAFHVEGQDFSPADLKARAGNRGPNSFAPQDGKPKHFSPADAQANPTEGWDPFAAANADQPPAGASSFIDPIKAAHDMGYAEGIAHDMGYAEGMVAGQAAAAEAQARDRALFEGLATALRAGGQLDREKMAGQLRQTVLHLVRRLVGEVGIAPDLLAKRITVAAEMLADSAESALLHVHPDDVPLLDGKLPKTIFAAGDASVVRGSFVLESASTIVEDGPELWLEQLTQAIDRIAVPRD
ncbi:flagellar biosynthesis protein FliH [Sphingomonas koreensis]|nr:flagellar biosynthesis protein FliH [Sphingomonas koreensis]